ncbi:hypothetical protein AUTU_33270 [Aureibacter tunicatorum]|nr:hypothetical protein AUTU_33270 [Aureibacter tunicatorum]
MYSKAQSFDHQWTKSYDQSGISMFSIPAVDEQGNVYKAGNFSNTIDLDDTENILEVTSKGDQDIFIEKRNDNGDFVWATSIGGSGNDNVESIAIDDQGNIYVTGKFTGTVDFDASDEVFELTSQDGGGSFVMKMDAQGGLVWVKAFGYNESNYQMNLLVNDNQEIYYGGSFSDKIDFSFDETPNILGAEDDCAHFFLMKINSQGEQVWIEAFGSAGCDNFGNMTFDNEGNVLFSGSVMGEIVGDNETSSNFILYKFDSQGEVVWQQEKLGTGDDTYFASTVDEEGNIYSTGWFYGTVDFNSSDEVNNLTMKGFYDVFVMKQTSEGEFVWANSIVAEQPTSINVDLEGNVIVTGLFSEDTDLDPSEEGEFIIEAQGEWDIYFQKLDNDGNFLEGYHIGNEGDDGAISFIDAKGDLYTYGYYSGAVDFDFSEEGEHTLIANDGGSWFLQKISTACEPTYSTDVQESEGPFTWIDGNIYTEDNNTATYIKKVEGQCDEIITLNLTVTKALGIDEDLMSKGVVLFPNPVENILTINNSSNSQMSIQLMSPLGNPINTISGSANTQIDMSNLISGVYLLKIEIDHQAYYKKVIKK